MARPSKYTPERVKRILDALKGGSSRRDAYEYGGIDSETFANWLKRYSDFSEQVRDAESQVAVFHAANITKAGREGDWKASLEWLKRRRRADWGDNATLTIEAEVNRIVAELLGEASADGIGSPPLGIEP